MDYDAFGNRFIGDEPDPFGYCGEYYDSESGLVYLRNRYYDSVNGRFITEDPAQDGLNWYSYCGNNPINFVDSFGLKIRLDTVNDANWEVVLNYLDVLTRDTLAVDEYGYVYLKEWNPDASDRPSGTELIYQLINHDKTITVISTEGDNRTTPDDKQLTTGSGWGSDSTVYININERDTVNVYDNGTVVQEESPIQMALGHELLHAYYNANGKRPIDAYGYYWVKGKWEVPKRENVVELNVVGIEYYRVEDDIHVYANTWYFSENSLRRENGYRERVTYDPTPVK